MPKTPIPLKSGDLLLFDRPGWANWLIKIKTWSRVSHCEVVWTDASTLASRNGIGVGCYQLDLAGLCYILRPVPPLDLAAGYRWFETRANGADYDWLGLLSFVVAKWQRKLSRNAAMFCSEFATGFYRACGFDPFGPLVETAAVAPGSYLYSNDLTVAWRKAGY
jgi:hypothetical protein